MPTIQVLMTNDRSEVLNDLAYESHVTIVTTKGDAAEWRTLADGAALGPRLEVLDGENLPTTGLPGGAVVIDQLGYDVDVTGLTASCSRVVVLTGTAPEVELTPADLLIGGLAPLDGELASAGFDGVHDSDGCCASVEYTSPAGAVLSVFVSYRTPEFGRETPLSVGWPASVTLTDATERFVAQEKLAVRSIAELTAFLRATIPGMLEQVSVGA